MKMPTLLNANDLDQWLYKSKKVQDPLAAFKKMTISGQDQAEQKVLFRLPSILTSDNAGTWLVTRKNKNDNIAEKKAQNETEKMEENSKWLLKPKPQVKVETDVVTLTEEVNPWLARPTPTTTTNLNNLPGKRTTTAMFNLPAKLESQDPNLWLLKPKQNKNDISAEAADNLNDWLLVPKSKSQDFKAKNLLDPWFEKSSTMSWTSSNDNNSRVEEWLKNALEDETDDFDDCSIEILS